MRDDETKSLTGFAKQDRKFCLMVWLESCWAVMASKSATAVLVEKWCWIYAVCVRICVCVCL